MNGRIHGLIDVKMDGWLKLQPITELKKEETMNE